MPASLHLLNKCREAGIRMGDHRHPVKKLEKWPRSEALAGVAGGASVPLLGSVVLSITFKRNRPADMIPSEGGPSLGPSVPIRFKICAKGRLGQWVTMIIGAQTLDHPDKGGLGFQVRSDTYYLSALKTNVDRAEDPSMYIRPEGP